MLNPEREKQAAQIKRGANYLDTYRDMQDALFFREKKDRKL
ncbi:hypothetical protein [Pectobacterium versatile]|nr:hypothetical protein [Pectobacterium versatile]